MFCATALLCLLLICPVPEVSPPGYCVLWYWVFVCLVVALYLTVVIQSLSRMTSFEELKTQALALGLDGQEVGRYVLAQQTAEREERALEREERKRQDEMEERKREREFELAKLQAEKDLERARIDASSKPAPPPLVGEYVNRPRLPAYQDGDDYASYLTRFERIAELLKVDKEAYAVRLGAL